MNFLRRFATMSAIAASRVVVENVDGLSTSSRCPRQRARRSVNVRQNTRKTAMTRGRNWAMWTVNSRSSSEQCEQSIHAVAQSKIPSIQHARDHCEISLTKAVESRSKNHFPKTKGNISCALLVDAKWSKIKSVEKLAELQGYRRAGTSGKQLVDKSVFHDNRPGKHGDSRELSAAASRADIMTTLRYSNGWISAQELQCWHFKIIQRECVKSCGLRKNMRAEKNRPANSSNDWTLVITCAWHYHKSQTADNT